MKRPTQVKAPDVTITVAAIGGVTYSPTREWLRYLNDLDAYIKKLEAAPAWQED